jgi:hypothetical protein
MSAGLVNQVKSSPFLCPPAAPSLNAQEPSPICPRNADLVVSRRKASLHSELFRALPIVATLPRLLAIKRLFDSAQNPNFDGIPQLPVLTTVTFCRLESKSPEMNFCVDDASCS